MKIIIKSLLLLAVCFLYTSCELDKDPVSTFSEKTIAGDTDDSEVKFATKAEMETQYNAMYSLISGSAQQEWTLDLLVFSDTHSDNAYSGGTGNNLVTLEAQSQDADNGVIERSWNKYLSYVNTANIVILNVDKVPDQSLTDAERKRWKAEAKIFRGWIMLDLVRLWGDIPVVVQETPEITAENIEEVYPLLYPERKPVEEVYAQIVQDLQEAVADAPAVDANNKFLLTKGVANALLAKAYAEKPLRDYDKVVKYCSDVEAAGYDLMPEYSDLFAANDAKTDVRYRNTKESIFEITYSPGSGQWLWSMYGVNELNPASTYNWAKYLTPSRDLIRAFEDEGDAVRMKESMVFASPSWTHHYKKDDPYYYPFMYKLRTNATSIIKIRFADILLLKAEALVEQNKLSDAEALVNRVRNRAKLANLPTGVVASQGSMRDAVDKERRLELAFEGHRWFDLVRTGRVLDVMNSLPARDEGRRKSDTLTEERVLFPVPQTQIDINPNLTQNKGY
ncbi:RagB/SusD family nutrient uptake outer membrane protein [Bacteroides sp. 51]|uniref:RagB/SusD family nutrient uptake outer membrane protein n=1 Tax=Bacteroides sp. 51 TaxID=2302938 RepID=UPI0019402686|nr:RagB/SusD family nutrient uptake outer membrane protein [Bacteroides sp. 51]NDV83984.1 RagB/SusD family nutrient uptake outer membrane protein [Bacteroides sp. 51]